MKKFIAALTLTTLSFSAFATSNQAVLELKGNIASKMSISINNPEVDLDLVNGHDDEVIAVVTEKSNRKEGYKVSISSANGGVLKNGSLDSISYDLSYGTTALTNASGEVEYDDQQALGLGSDKNIKITVAPQTEESKVSGDYTDTITFTIANN